MNLITVFQVFPTFIFEFSFKVAINLSKSYIHPNIIHSRSTANNNAKLFKNASNTPRIKLPAPVANIDETHTPTIHTIVADFLREKLNFSEFSSLLFPVHMVS